MRLRPSEAATEGQSTGESRSQRRSPFPSWRRRRSDSPSRRSNRAGSVTQPASWQRARTSPRRERFLVYVYDHPLFGIFYVQQRQLEGAREDAQASLEALGSPDWCPRGHVCPAKRSLVELANGQTALLVLSQSVGSGTNFIEFLTPVSPVRVEVAGPPDSFGARDAAAVADLLIEAAGRPS
jgi:hypothetical protein